MTEFALIGDGRLATSLAPFLKAHQFSFLHWSRRREARGDCAALGDCIQGATTVLIAIRDDAIKPWAEENKLLLAGKTLVHFSGALCLEGMIGLHPLFAFPKEAVSSEIIAQIVFIGDEGAPKFAKIFPNLPNTAYQIPPEARPLYHALAVLSGNMATFLWNETAKIVDQDLGLPPEALLRPYFQSLLSNFAADPFDSLTGPIKRADMTTINKNLDALREKSALKSMYEAFLTAALSSPSGDSNTKNE